MPVDYHWDFLSIIVGFHLSVVYLQHQALVLDLVACARHWHPLVSRDSIAVPCLYRDTSLRYQLLCRQALTIYHEDSSCTCRHVFENLKDRDVGLLPLIPLVY